VADRSQWLSGARPRTLPAAVSPVSVGTGAAAAMNAAVPGRALLALTVALSLQVGVNYANDYSDGIRGTDASRVGPFRLTGSGAARPEAVKRAALGAFGTAAVAGLALVWLSGSWWLLGVGAACVLAAWYYTGGRRPYGYAGLGEVSVFVFFGLVAVLGTTYTQAGRISGAAVGGAIGVGALACAILVANNLRDVPSDRAAGKLTLAVRLGDAATRRLYQGLLVVAAVAALAVVPRHPGGLAALLAAPAAVPPLRAVRGGATGAALVPVLRDTGRLELLYGLLLALGLAVS
jgi:1,4-dihydroxy-2-naphthoate polyprenyltransferase